MGVLCCKLVLKRDGHTSRVPHTSEQRKRKSPLSSAFVVHLCFDSLSRSVWIATAKRTEQRPF